MPGVNDRVAEAESRIGTVLRGKWRIERLLGLGGMAAVYEAQHKNHSRVAVKILHRRLGLSAEQVARFQREGYAANRVGHQGVVEVYDDDVDEQGSAFLVMELLSGQSVAERAAASGKLPPEEVLAIADGVLDVLAAAHARGILHRDIKPENLFMTKQGELKVLDFGIARLADSELTVSATEVGTLLGTPAFLPPEQARGLVNSIDARTDLWAVGATMFTLLTGRFVHEASTPNEQLGLAMTASARSLSEVQPASPAALASIVDRALAYAQSNRWKDARAMQDAVRWAREHWDEIAKTPETVPAEWGAVAPARPQMDTLGDEPPFPSLHRDEEPVSSTHAEVNRQRPGIVAKVAAALIILGGVVAYWSAGQPVRPPESQVSSAARVAMAMGAPKQPAPTIPGTAEKAPQQAAIMPPTPSVAPSTAAPAPSPVPRSTRTPDRVRAPAALGSQRVVGTAQLPSPSSTPAGPEPGSRDLYDRRL